MLRYPTNSVPQRKRVLTVVDTLMGLRMVWSPVLAKATTAGTIADTSKDKQMPKSDEAVDQETRQLLREVVFRITQIADNPDYINIEYLYMNKYELELTIRKRVTGPIGRSL